MSSKIILLIIVLIVVLIIGGYIFWQYIYWDIGGPFPKPPTIPFISKCFDTDGGKNPALLGEISFIGEKNKKNDFCVKMGGADGYGGIIQKEVGDCLGEDCFVREYYCEKDRPKYDYIPCFRGCKNGVCI